MQATQSTQAGERTQHTPGPWATDISEAVQTIRTEGSYDGFQTLKDALENIIGAKTVAEARKLAANALREERDDCRIDGAVVYRNDGSSAQGGQVCSFPHDPNSELTLDAETIANAHLVAAAPELLYTLLGLLEFADNGTPIHPGALVLTEARVAVNHALGME